MVINRNANQTKSSEGKSMKNEFDEYIKAANMIAIARMLLREEVIDKVTYNTLVRRIKMPT